MKNILWINPFDTSMKIKILGLIVVAILGGVTGFLIR
jgi:hypothetical protein